MGGAVGVPFCQVADTPIVLSLPRYTDLPGCHGGLHLLSLEWYQLYTSFF